MKAQNEEEKEQVGMNLRKSYPPHLVNENGEVGMSVYSGKLTPQEGAKQSARLKAAFPSLPPEFFAVFFDRMKEKGFSDDRMRDAVNNVIDTCKYPVPTIANFTSFDKNVRLYTYNEVVLMVTKKEASFSDFSIIKRGNEVYRVKKSDKANYNLPDEL